MSARLEAAEAVERPITVVQGLATAAPVALAASAGVAGWLATRTERVWDRLSAVSGADLTQLVAMVQDASPLGLVAAIVGSCLLVVTPILCVVALSGE